MVLWVEEIMNVLVATIYPILLCIIVFVLLSHNKIHEIVVKNWKWILLFVLANVLVINLLLSMHLVQESFIPFWDYGGYWRRTLEVVKMADRSMIEFVDNLIHSICYTEYSYLAEVFLYLPTKILGNTFNDFIIGMFNFFVLPFNTMLFLFYLLYKEKNNQELNKTDCLIALFIIFFAGNIMPMVLGYIGTSGLVFIMPIILLIYVGAFERFNFKYTIFSGLCLLIIVLCRRWFAFWVVSFFAGFVLNTIWFAIKDKKIDVKKQIPLYLNLFITGIVPLAILLIFFMPMVNTFLNNNYAEAYSVVWGSTTFEAIEWFINFYGILVVLVVLFAIVSIIKDRDKHYFVLLMLWQIFVTLILFSRMQGLGVHHYYMINVPMLILSIIGLNYLVNIKKLGIIFVSALVGISMINYTNTTFLADYNYQIEKLTALTGDPLPDLRIRNDIDEIRELADFINDVANEEYEYVYSLAAGSDFNTDTLRYSWYPEREEPIKNLLTPKIYDFRDGIPQDFFFYKFIVVSTPLAVHTEENQYTVTILHDFIHNDSISEKYYQMIKETEIDGGRMVYVYERILQVPNEIRQYVSDQFKEIYPENPEYYEFDMLEE